jgi:transposase
MDGVAADGQGLQAGEPGKRIRRQWTTEDKRRIVREAERPGAVRQQVAQRHGVHVSVLNRWRAELRVAAAGVKKKVRSVRLLPVQIRQSRPRPRTPTAVPGSDFIEVALPAGQRITIRGTVDGVLLRTVLQELSRC